MKWRWFQKGGKLEKNEGMKGDEQCCPEKFGQKDQNNIFKLSFQSKPTPILIFCYNFKS